MTDKAIWTIKDRDCNVTTVPNDPEARPHMPEHLPTYRRLHCIHSDNPPMETRLRAASLEDSCRHMDTTPPTEALMDAIHRYGTVTDQQADQLREFIASLDGNTYLIHETMLLLEAARHVEHHPTVVAQTQTAAAAH